jgi:dihydroorotate dehydrogenase (fumarate)
MPDLSTTHLGLALRNPLIASASPLTLDLGNIRALEDAGAAAVVLPSVFEEQIDREDAEHEAALWAGAESVAEASSFLPPVSWRSGPHLLAETIRRARAAVDIPVIASLNGVTAAGWTSYAAELEQAGASAIELNVYFVPTDPALTGGDVEAHYLDVLRAVKLAVRIPVAMKLGPFFSAPGAMVRALDDAGADGFVLFNRFYQPDIDLATMRVQRDLSLSTPAELRLPLLWLGVLAGTLRGSLAASTGVESADQVVKYLLAGADAVMTTSALLRHGVGHMATLVDGLTEWLDAREADLADIKGRMSRARLGDADAYERANYIRILHGWRPG